MRVKRLFLVTAATLSLNLSMTAQSVRMQNATVKQAIKRIQQTCGYSFVYEANDLNTDKRVNINADNCQDAVKQVLEGQGVKYNINGKTVIISKESDNKPQTKIARQKFTGVVKDENGDPIIGATVRVKNDTNNGTITDIDGRFTLEAEAGSTLQVSYIGYLPQDIKLGRSNNLDLTMMEDKKLLDEVVVVGYGTMKKSDLTGSVASANLKDFEHSPNTNVASMLQGTIAGLNVGQTTSSGSTPEMSIRGKNTLSGNSNVLIVLDGIIYTSSLSSLNPNDIASIDVLKDASATAVYGAQAANGVILITTKKGSSSKTRVDFSSSFTISNPTKDLRPMNREEYLNFTREFWYDKAYIGPDYTTPNPEFRIADYMPDKVMLDDSQPDGLSALDYDWWGEGTQTGKMFENRLSVSGGSEYMSYLLSFSNTNQEGYIKNDDFKRNSVRVNLDVKPLKWLNFGLQSFGSFVNQDGAEPSMWGLLTECPLISPYDANGEIVPYPFQTLDENPFMGSNVQDKERHNYFFANLYAEVKLPLKGLSYRINFGNNYRIDNHFKASEYGASLTGEAYKQHTEYYDYTLDNIINYVNSFGEHDLNVTLLYGASERKNNYTNAVSQDFSRLTLGYNRLELGKNQYTYSSAWSEALLYQMARVNYKYKDRYLVTATVRRDGFSGFASNNKFATFPSIALAWVISQEKWFKVSWIDQLKLRSGWGISGNQTSRYKSLSQMSSAAAYVFGDGGTTEVGQKMTSMASNDLKWEKTTGINFGIDFVLFNNRINGSIEYYNSTTKDLLYDMAIPTITGFSSISSNIGKIRNRGIEFNITSRNIITKDFEWSTTFNISSNSNKIVTLTGLDADGDGKEDDLIASNLFIGQPIGAIYNYKINGIWQLDDDIPAGYNPGNYRVVDTNGDGEITPDDRVILGKTDPAYRLGLLNSLRYKDFTLSFFINSVQGGSDGYLGQNSETLTRGDANSRRWNRPSELAADYWSPNNPNATYSRAINGGTISPTLYQDRSFIRLQDVNFAYQFPKSWINAIGIQGASIFVSGKNLITITDWKGRDPEANSGYYGRPVLRSVSFGFNFTL